MEGTCNLIFFEAPTHILQAMKATMPKTGDADDIMDDTDDDVDGDDDDIPSDLEEMSDDDEDGGLSLAEASGDEDLMSLNGDMPDGLIEFDEAEDEAEPEEEEWGGIGAGGGTKRKRDDEDKKSKRKKLKALPTFASYEDYAKMIEDGPEDDI